MKEPDSVQYRTRLFSAQDYPEITAQSKPIDRLNLVIFPTLNPALEQQIHQVRHSTNKASRTTGEPHGLQGLGYLIKNGGIIDRCGHFPVLAVRNTAHGATQNLARSRLW